MMGQIWLAGSRHTKTHPWYTYNLAMAQQPIIIPVIGAFWLRLSSGRPALKPRLGHLKWITL